jgi:hypothetical protein
MNVNKIIEATKAWASESSGFFYLMPYEEAVTHGVPFSVTFQYKGSDFAVIIPE